MIGGLALLWLAVWGRQHAQWQGDPEMRYGWAVPLLVVFLAMERWRGFAPEESGAGRSRSGAAWFWSALLLFAITALFLEAFPTWTAMLWLQTAAAVTLTLNLVGRLLGRSAIRHFAFPAVFAFVALPWPAALQQRLVPALTTMIARIGAAALNEGGYPAIAHGNVIEVTHGWVGIEEACSGIRSLQCAVMVALFLGEYLLLSAGRRTALGAAAIGSALAANLSRVLFLSWQAARSGPGAVAGWHDRAGDLTYVLAMAGIGLAAWWLHLGSPSAVQRSCPAAPPRVLANAAAAERRAWAAGLIALGSTGAAFLWFESNPAARPLAWTFHPPLASRAYQSMPISAESQALLRCDRAEGAAWSAPDGTRCAAYFLHWGRGRGGESSTLLHNPLICLPAAGAQLVGDRGQERLPIGNAWANFHLIDFEQDGVPFLVGYTVAQSGWDALARGGTLAARWQAVRARQRGDEVQLLAVAEWGQVPAPFAARVAEVTEIR